MIKFHRARGQSELGQHPVLHASRYNTQKEPKAYLKALAYWKPARTAPVPNSSPGVPTSYKASQHQHLPPAGFQFLHLFGSINTGEVFFSIRFRKENMSLAFS